ncbi:MAG: FHA domain-containing protein [Pseudomonadota bacterium]
MSIALTEDRRKNSDRRIIDATPLFPFFDSEETLVSQDRRQITDRRISSQPEIASKFAIPEIKLQEADNDEELYVDEKLFIWFNDDIHQVERNDEGVWLGRSSECFARFESSYVSRQHARLYFDKNKYYLVDNSMNGTYVKNDDGEVFITKEKVVMRGSGVISLGVPFEHSESNVIHYFIG